MMATKLTCDRCGREIYGNDRRYRLGYEPRFNLRVGGLVGIADLCPSCMSALKLWLASGAKK